LIGARRQSRSRPVGLVKFIEKKGTRLFDAKHRKGRSCQRALPPFLSRRFTGGFPGQCVNQQAAVKVPLPKLPLGGSFQMGSRLAAIAVESLPTESAIFSPVLQPKESTQRHAERKSRLSRSSPSFERLKSRRGEARPLARWVPSSTNSEKWKVIRNSKAVQRVLRNQHLPNRFGRIASNQRILFEIDYLTAHRSTFVREPVDRCNGDFLRKENASRRSDRCRQRRRPIVGKSV